MQPSIARLMKIVTEAPTREAALGALAMAVEELQTKLPKVARLLEEHGEEMLAVYALPEEHRKRMRTTNMLERQNQELKRRTAGGPGLRDKKLTKTGWRVAQVSEASTQLAQQIRTGA